MVYTFNFGNDHELANEFYSEFFLDTNNCATMTFIDAGTKNYIVLFDLDEDTLEDILKTDNYILIDTRHYFFGGCWLVKRKEEDVGERETKECDSQKTEYC